jgi:hypothetical protein
MSFTDRRNFLARHGGPLLLHPDFRPNFGRDVHPLPESIAPFGPLELHAAKLVRSGEAVALPLSVARRLCSRDKLSLHLSNTFLAEKLDDVTMRFISDYTNSQSCGTNHPDKSPLLAQLWSPLSHPSCADLCQLVMNARVCHPGEPIFGCRLEIKNAYPRFCIAPRDIPLSSLLIPIHSSPDSFVLFPLTARFGCQDTNYWWHFVPLEVIARAHARSDLGSGCHRTSGFTDDYFSFGSESFVRQEILDITADIEEIVAPGSISPDKTLFGQHVPIIGYQLDLVNFTIGVLEKHFGKMFHQLFSVLPADPLPGDPIPLSLAQSVSSNMIRLANLIPALLPFSRGLSNNQRGLHHSSPSLHLSKRSIMDIWMWRAAFHSALSDCRWLSVPITTPLLFRYLPRESDNDRAIRQASLAAYVVFADACTTIHGLGTYIPCVGWAHCSIPSLTHYYNNNAELTAVDINVLEFTASLLALIHLLRYLHLSALPSHAIHAHVWTDNTSCKSWMTTYCVSHPLHCFLLQVYSLIQTHFGLIATSGYLKGALNCHADAASRQFDCTDGRRLEAELNQLPHQFPACSPLLALISLVAMSPSLPTCALTQLSVTALAKIISYVSAPSTQ